MKKYEETRIVASRVREFYESCRSIKKTAEHFGLNANTLKARIRREGWAKR